MKRTICLLLALCAASGLLGGCRSETAEESTELVVFAAASLTETLTEIAGDYKTAAPGVATVFNFDSSGTLKTQMEEGADCDVFLSAAPKQMNELEELGLVAAESRIDLLENKVAPPAPGRTSSGRERT